MSRTIIIAQARMGSTRLPGKVMMDLAGRPVIDHVIERAQRARKADSLIIATPDLAEDAPLVAHVRALGVDVVTGSADDVLARYVKAARESRADVVVRVTCDCPLLDPGIVDEVIEAFYATGADYCSNTLKRTYPIGVDTEVFTAESLFTAEAEATEQQQREHVTPFLYQHPERFKLHNVEAPEWAHRPELRLTVDEQADLDLVREIVKLAGPAADLGEVLAVLDANPGLADRNAGVAHRHVAKPESW